MKARQQYDLQRRESLLMAAQWHRLLVYVFLIVGSSFLFIACSTGTPTTSNSLEQPAPSAQTESSQEPSDAASITAPGPTSIPEKAFISIDTLKQLQIDSETVLTATASINRYVGTPNGEAILYQGGIGQLYQYNWAEQTAQQMFEFPASGISDLVLGPDLSTAIVACDEFDNNGYCMSSQVFYGAVGQQPKPLIKLIGWIDSLTISPRGGYLLVDDDRGGTYIITLPDGKVIYDPYSDNVANLLRLPDLGQIWIAPNDQIAAIVMASGTRLRLFTLPAMEEIGEIELGNATLVHKVAFTSDGRTLAAKTSCFGCDGDTVFTWDVARQEKIAEKEFEEALFTNVLAYSPDNSLLALSGCTLEGCSNYAIVLLETASLEPVARLATSEELVEGLLFSADGTTMTVFSNSSCRSVALFSDEEICQLEAQRWRLSDTVIPPIAGQNADGTYDRSLATALELTTITSGELSAGQIQLYRFEAEAEERRYVILATTAFAPEIQVIGPDNRSIEIANGQYYGFERPYAGIGFLAEQPGEYLVIVRADEELTPEGSGPFSLQLIDNRTVALSYGETANRRVLFDGPSGRYTFEGQAGDVVTITLSAVEHTTRFDLLSAEGERIALSGAPVEYTAVAQLKAFTLPETGMYTIETNMSREEGSTAEVAELTLTLQKE
jgi:hypothetical protein